MNNAVRASAACFFVYGVLLIANTAANLDTLKDSSDVTTLVLRIVATAATIFGLMLAQKWAWLLGIALSALMALAGIVGMGAIYIAGAPDGVSVGYIAYVAVSTIVLIAAFMLLISPQGLSLLGVQEKPDQ